MRTLDASTTAPAAISHGAQGAVAAPPRPAVFILSDVRLYREGLAANLRRDASLDVIGASEPSAAALQQIDCLVPAAVIVDITIRDALDLARDLRRRVPNAKIVAFAVSDIDGETVIGATAGISGYVHRDGSVADLVNEVHRAVRGELHCSPRLAALLVQKIAMLSEAQRAAASDDAETDEAQRPLTRREVDILALIAKGQSNKEIARALNISFSTVKNHVHHILEKLQVKRRTQLLARLQRR